MCPARPECELPSEVFYSNENAEKYTNNSRINKIQYELANRCIDLLELTPDAIENGKILDIGCGSGISGDALSELGVAWTGIDNSADMIELCKQRHMANPKADFVLADIGTKQDFEPGSYAGAISVSCIQWLCHSFQSDHNPRTRLRVFFQWLYDVLSTDARAVLQFYPSDDNQVALIGKAAASVGFSTFFYVDNPDSKKNKKLFLICTFGQPTDPDSVIASALSEMNSTEHGRKLKNGKKGAQSRKQRVLNKKERQRSLGKVIKNDSKYTARKRKDKF